MKKLISLVLSIMMVCILGVDVFTLTPIELKPNYPTIKEPIILEDTITFEEDSDNVLFAQSPSGGKFYVPISYNGKELANIEITANGLSVKLIEFNPETMIYPGHEITYSIYFRNRPVGDPDTQGLTYEEAKKKAEELSHLNKRVYKIMPETYIYVAEFTVDSNYGTSFTEGQFQIKAVEKESGTKLATPKITIINDVVFFNYENVKYCAKYDYMLKVGDKGYSDYYTYNEGYDSTHAYEEGAVCISKTAFRAISGKKLSILLNDNDKLVMKVLAGQCSINLSNYFEVDEKERTIKFGFYGHPIIAGEFEYDVELGMNVYELANFFKLSFTEKDVYTFYVLKEGKVINSFTVDYSTNPSYDDIVLKLKGKNTHLGNYELSVTGEQVAEEVVPPVINDEEYNPNTGAEVTLFKVCPKNVIYYVN